MCEDSIHFHLNEKNIENRNKRCEKEIGGEEDVKTCLPTVQTNAGEEQMS